MPASVFRVILNLPLLLVLICGTTWTTFGQRLSTATAEEAEDCELVVQLHATPSRAHQMRHAEPQSARRLLPHVNSRRSVAMRSLPEILILGHRLPNGLNAPLRT